MKRHKRHRKGVHANRIFPPGKLLEKGIDHEQKADEADKPKSRGEGRDGEPLEKPKGQLASMIVRAGYLMSSVTRAPAILACRRGLGW